MTQLRAVLFDLDDTLFSTTAFAKKARLNAVRGMIRAGLDLPEEEVLRELSEVISEFTSNYDRHLDQLLRRLRPKALQRVNPAVLVASGVAAYHDTKFRELAPFEDVKPFLEDLRKAGMRRGIITHGRTTKQAEKLIRLGLLPHLDADAIFISEQIGISKPNPKLYATALRDLGLDPLEAMYVGDNPAHDIAPPHSLGMVTVWAKRSARRLLTDKDVQPDHIIADFSELRTILRERYGVAIPVSLSV
ncbi:MAG: putative hydrolase of the HAD superfamily [Planctomycetota bacterium]|jgi:putative hydrolase of the HAD superfamily